MIKYLDLGRYLGVNIFYSTTNWIPSYGRKENVINFYFLAHVF